MERRAGDVNVQRGNFNEVKGRMDNIINQLRSEWEGKASESFYQQFQDLKPFFERMDLLFEELNGQLMGTARIMRQTDADIASQFQVR